MRVWIGVRKCPPPYFPTNNFFFSSHRTNIRTPGREPDSPLPPIHERLAYLRPSRELLEFYRQKIAQFDGEHEELLQMLEKYRGITEDQVRHTYGIASFSGTPEYIFACLNLSTLRPGSPSSISYSGTYDSVKARSWSCKTL